MRTEAGEFRRDFEERSIKFQEREDEVDGFKSARNSKRNTAQNSKNKDTDQDLDNQV